MKKTIWGALCLMIAFSLPTAAQSEQKTYTYAGHTYTQKGTLTAKQYDRKASGVVTFTNVPSSYEEFEALYTNFLGKTPHGTAAMMVMAMEIYGRDREMGKQCIELINYPSNVNSVIPRLNDKYGTSQYAPENDSYHQRYLPAAVLKGATPQNGYTPQQPYTVEMKASVNKHQELQIVGSGRVMYLYVMGKGWDTEQRSVEIIRQPNQPLYKIFNCPSLYTQCKTIQGTWPGLK
jgi:hypothetical protein